MDSHQEGRSHIRVEEREEREMQVSGSFSKIKHKPQTFLYTRSCKAFGYYTE